MAATIHQLPSSCGAAQEDPKDSLRDPSKRCYSKPSPRPPQSNHTTTGEPLWLDSWGTPSWVHGERRRPEFVGEPSHGTLSTAQIDSLLASIRACTRNKNLIRGTSIHHDLVQRGLLENCADALVAMYANCGEFQNAKVLLDVHNSKDVITWTTLMAGYAREGQGQNALDCLERMQCAGILPNEVTYVCALKACATIRAFDKGKQIHDEIARQGFLHNHFVLDGALVDMYAKCGAVSEARRVLEELPSRNVVSWSALIAGYAQEGKGEQALNCLEQMQSEGILPDAVTYVCALKACATIRAAERGKQIHNKIVRQGLLQNNIVLGGALVDMYAKCGDVSEARWVLKGLPSGVVPWNALIGGYVQEGEAEQALSCLKEMQHEGILPNAVTYVYALKACATMRSAYWGKQIHDEIARQGLLQNDILLGGALVDMYAKCGAISEARRVFEELPSRNVVSWSTLIAGYAKKGEAEQALNCLEQMQCEDILPDAATYVCTLKACATIRAADRGKQIHDEIASQGLLQDNIALGNALVDMYAKCRALSEARRVLQELPSRNVVSWNALIAGYAQEGEAEQVLDCLTQMQREGILPDAVTYVSTLKACATIRAADRGKQIHDEIVMQGLLQNNIVLGGALVDMYAKCGALSEARRVLEELPSRNVVSWNALIAGYAEEGEAQEALDCLEQMQCEGILPNALTYVCALKACAMIRAADKGKGIHNDIAMQRLLENDIVLGCALVDMYAKCGDFSEARRVLNELPSRDVVSWNALIAGYAQEGAAEEALNCLEEMQCEGILPNAVTCTCVLNVCSHRGLVEEGQALFVKMSTKYGVQPSLDCCICMIDLFGRAGLLEKAVNLIQEMPTSDNIAIWHTLLGACRKWADVNVGGWAFEQAVKVDKSDGPAYVLMENIYAAAGMEEESKRIKAMRVKNQAGKKPGSIEIVHEFSNGDTTKHAQNKCMDISN